MRKASHDGADSNSITSTIDNEVKKAATGLKTKRSSIKRKIPNFSHESDDTVIEPLLSSEKDKVDNASQSAKFVMSKSKTDLTTEKVDRKLLKSKVEKISPTYSTSLSENIVFTSTKDLCPNMCVTTPIYNHMNTNVFGDLDATKIIPSKSTVIVEINKSKSSSYSSSPLIFTTAKIHTDNKTNHMEPVQVTPMPILSTIEGNIIKPLPSNIDRSEKKFELANPKTENPKIVIRESAQKTLKTTIDIKESTNAATLSIEKPADTKIASSYCKNNSSTIITKSTDVTKSPISLDKLSVVQIPIITNEDINITSENKVTTINNPKNMQDCESCSANNNKTKKDTKDKPLHDFSKSESKIPVWSNENKKNYKKQSVNTPPSEKQFSHSSKDVIATTTMTSNTSVKYQEKPSKPSSSVPGYKQLQRQKKATVEDNPDLDSTIKQIDCNYSDSSNISTQFSSANISVTSAASVSENKSKAEKCDIVNTFPMKPSTTVSYTSIIQEISNPLNSVPKSKNIISSAKTTLSGPKSLVTTNNYPQPLDNITRSDISKSTSAIKPTLKETFLDAEKPTEPQIIVTSVNSKLSSNTGLSKISSPVNSELQVISGICKSNNTTLPSVTAHISSKTCNTTGVTNDLANQAGTPPSSSKTLSTNCTRSVDLKSSATSAKSLISNDKKIEPLLNEHKKDSRA
ncbi:unnamed protein product [Parnassius apollo]|uniref:(apollo) hypothetical protein n=1 Tax=Parnassius apollo TaxID=110799 RepID=A0A8S3WLS9_PARAO|nr:unnamed protein product [Parnassius apollo]